MQGTKHRNDRKMVDIYTQTHTQTRIQANT
jgi:hypothetical protein